MTMRRLGAQFRMGIGKRARVQANIILDRFRKTAAMPTYRSRFLSLVTPRSRAGRLRLSAARRFSLLSIFGAMGNQSSILPADAATLLESIDTLLQRWNPDGHYEPFPQRSLRHPRSPRS